MTDYPFQVRVAARWAALPEPRRLILSWPTSAGKSKSALLAARGYTPLVIVSPSLGIGGWYDQCVKWLGEEPGVYDKSLSRKQLSKREKARLEQALRQRVIVTTPYFAFSDVALQQVYTNGMCLILDEGDMYATPEIERSVELRALLARFPATRVLLLTATLFPKEIRDVWNPVQTLFPAVFPAPRKDTGGVPFAFLHRYADRDKNGYFKGTRKDRLDELRGILERVADMVSEEEVLRVVPPLRILGLAGDEKTHTKWISEHEKVRSLCMAAWTREQAEEYGRALEARLPAGAVVDTLHGGVPAKKRWERLQALRAAYREGKQVALACTADAFLTNLSLAFFERALITQWRSTPRQALQFLGRFRRVDPDKRVPAVLDLLVEDGQERLSAETQARLDAFQHLLGASANAEAFTQALRDGGAAQLAVEFTADEVREMFSRPEHSESMDAWFGDDSEDDD